MSMHDYYPTRHVSPMARSTHFVERQVEAPATRVGAGAESCCWARWERADAWKETGVHVAELWRHPVKSLQGEPLDEAVVEDSGLAGDRRWGIVDSETGVVLTGR